MKFLMDVSRILDCVLAFFGKLGALSGLLLVIAVCIDVSTRYLGAPKPFGLNSTQLQETEYWLHTFLFTLMIGWGYTRQAHVRIDLVSSSLPMRARFVIEMIGALFFLLGFSILGMWFTGHYAQTSYLNDESSKSVLGLQNVWILKSSLFLMFVLMAMSAISQFTKSLTALLQVSYRDEAVNPFGGQ